MADAELAALRWRQRCRFEDQRRALVLVNGTEPALAAYMFSRDAARVWRVAEALECGGVSVNSGHFSY